MPATPPPPSPPPFLPPVEAAGPITPPTGVVVPGTPPTSPQRFQQATRHQERSQRLMLSPEQRRIPATSAPLPLPAFSGQTYTHLPSDLAARIAALPPLIPLRRTTSHAQPAAGPSIPIPPPRSISAAPQSILNPAQLAAAYAALPPLLLNPRQPSVSFTDLYF